MTDPKAIHHLEQQPTALDHKPNPDVHTEINLLNDLAWNLSDIDLKRAFTLSETAYTLACAPADGVPPYQAGMAYSLRTQGYLNQRLGNHPLGLSQLLKALEICEALPLADALPDVLDGIAGIYFQIGDFPTALSYMHRQLAAAQHTGDLRRIANANNNLANIYLQMGDRTRTVETLQQNLQIAAAIGFARMEAISLLNLAEIHLLAGEYEQALDYALRGQHVSQAAGFELFEIYAYKTVGKINLKLGKTAAIPSLGKALAMAQALESKVIEVEILLELGKTHRDMQQLDLALEVLQQGVAVATTIDAKSELSTTHLLLAEVYEQMGDAAHSAGALQAAPGAQGTGRRRKSRTAPASAASGPRHRNAPGKRPRSPACARSNWRTLNERLEQQVATRTAELTATVALLQQEIGVREQRRGRNPAVGRNAGTAGGGAHR